MARTNTYVGAIALALILGVSAGFVGGAGAGKSENRDSPCYSLLLRQLAGRFDEINRWGSFISAFALNEELGGTSHKFFSDVLEGYGSVSSDISRDQHETWESSYLDPPDVQKKIYTEKLKRLMFYLKWRDDLVLGTAKALSIPDTVHNALYPHRPPSSTFDSFFGPESRMRQYRIFFEQQGPEGVDMSPAAIRKGLRSKEGRALLEDLKHDVEVLKEDLDETPPKK